MLVAHDLPRGLFYMRPWKAVELLTRAALSARALDVFDEVLFVARQDGPGKVIRIAVVLRSREAESYRID